MSCSPALADLETSYDGVGLARSEVVSRAVALDALATWGWSLSHVATPTGAADEQVAFCLFEGDDLGIVAVNGPPPLPGQDHPPRYITLKKVVVFEDGTQLHIASGESDDYARLLQMPSEL